MPYFGIWNETEDNDMRYFDKTEHTITGTYLSSILKPWFTQTNVNYNFYSAYNNDSLTSRMQYFH